MLFKRILPIGIILMACIFGIWKYQNPCKENSDSTYMHGWQGENPFDVMVERIPESCSFAPITAGANYVFSAQQGNSENWRQIMTVHNDDPIDFPQNNIKIVNEKIAYAFMNDKYTVTTDSGKTWNVWNVDKIPSGNFSDYGYIREVTITENGAGFLKLNPLAKNKEFRQFYTSDFGKHWKQTN